MTAAAREPEPPIPALPANASPQAIRAALLDDERAEFDRAYQAALASAAQTLDLTEVLDVLRTWWRVARVTQRHGAEAHRRALDSAARLLAGEDVPTVPGDVVKADIEARLGR